MNSKQTSCIRTRLWEETAGHCIYCGRPVSEEDMAVDHIEPRSLGGSDSFLNKVCACRACNAQKGNTPLEEYLLEHLSDSRLRRYRNRLNTLVEQGRMAERKAEDLYPIGSIYPDLEPDPLPEPEACRRSFFHCPCPFHYLSW